MKIAIDLGNQYVKAINENGEKIKFRSVIAQGKHRSLFSLNKYQAAKEDAIQVKYQGTEYFVGKMAERFGVLPEYVFGSERFDAESAEILIWTALAFLGRENGPIDVIVDYPYSQFNAVKDKLASRLTGKTETVQRHQTEPLQLSIRSVKEYPQSLAAVYALATTIPDTFDPELDGYVAVVDIGGHTTDVVVLETFGGDLMIHEELSGTIAHGTRDITQVIRRSLEAQTGDIMDADMADRVLDHGNVYFNGELRTFTDEIGQAKKQLISGLKAQITDLWGTRKNRIRSVIFVGGGAMLLGDDLQGFHENEILATEAQWKNAEGCLSAETDVQCTTSDSREVQKNQSTRAQAPRQDLHPPTSANNHVVSEELASRHEADGQTVHHAHDEETHVKHAEPTTTAVDAPSSGGSIPSRFLEGKSAWQ